LTTDSSQTTNVASQNPDIVSAMQTHYEEWWNGAPQGDDQIVPAKIGTDSQNPVIISSGYWEKNAVNTRWGVSAGDGGARGGSAHIIIESSGRYRVELSRWPFHLDRKLIDLGPSKTIGDTDISEGVAFPIEYGCFAIGDHVPCFKQKGDVNATKITMEVDLEAGQTTYQSWFADSRIKDVCPAYYVRFEKLSSSSEVLPQKLNYVHNLISNGDIETSEDWSGIPNTSDLQLSYVANEGVNNSQALKLVTTSVGDDGQYTVALDENFKLEKDKSVRMTFWAKASVDGLVVSPFVQEQDNNTWMYVGHTVLSTTWEKFEIEAAITSNTSSAYKLKLRAYEAGTIVVDNISIETNENTSHNLITNGYMEESTGWEAIQKGSDLQLSFASGEGVTGSQVLKATTSTMGSKGYYTLRRTQEFWLQNGDEVTLTFWAKSSIGGLTLTPWIQEMNPATYDWMNLGHVTLTTEWKQHTITTTISSITSSSYKLAFRATATTVISIDDVVFSITPDESSQICVLSVMDSYKISPNPVLDVLNINTEIKQVEYSIYDVSANMKKVGRGRMVDVSGLKSGVYFIMVNNTQVEKFIKQ
jgi:hypothetical protein